MWTVSWKADMDSKWEGRCGCEGQRKGTARRGAGLGAQNQILNLNEHGIKCWPLVAQLIFISTGPFPLIAR